MASAQAKDIATRLQRTLESKANDPKASCMATAQAVRAWKELQELKHDIDDRHAARAAARPRRTPTLVEAEPEPKAKSEGISFPKPPVPTPPTPPRS